MKKPHVIDANELDGWTRNIELASGESFGHRKRLVYAIVIGQESSNAYEVHHKDGVARFGDLRVAVEFYNEV